MLRKIESFDGLDSRKLMDVYAEGNETAAAFADWLISDEGQACIAQAGYVPLK